MISILVMACLSKQIMLSTHPILINKFQYPNYFLTHTMLFSDFIENNSNKNGVNRNSSILTSISEYNTTRAQFAD